MRKTVNNRFEFEWHGKKLHLICDPELDGLYPNLFFFADAQDEDGWAYQVRWDYVEPEWHEKLSPYDPDYYTNDMSDFADWDHPIEVARG